MITHIWTVLCESASIDNLSNRVSLFNTFDSLKVFGEIGPESPGGLQGELVSLWTRANIDQTATGKMRATYTDPNGNVSEPIELPVDLSKSLYHRTRLGIPGLPLLATGIYRFTVELQINDQEQWSPVAHIPILIEQVPFPTQVE